MWPLPKFGPPRDCQQTLVFRCHNKMNTANVSDYVLLESLLPNEHFPDENELNIFKNTLKPTWSMTLVCDLQKVGIHCNPH